jgi:hypothetical protein
MLNKKKSAKQTFLQQKRGENSRDLTIDEEASGGEFSSPPMDWNFE